jgi:hypothetical protein
MEMRLILPRREIKWCCQPKLVNFSCYIEIKNQAVKEYKISKFLIKALIFGDFYFLQSNFVRF